MESQIGSAFVNPKVPYFQAALDQMRKTLQNFRTLRHKIPVHPMTPQQCDAQVERTKNNILDNFDQINCDVKPELKTQVKESIVRRAQHGYQFKNIPERLNDPPAVFDEKIITQLMPNLGVQTNFPMTRPATVEEVEQTRQFLSNTNFNIDVQDPNAACHIMNAIAENHGLEFVLIQQPDANMIHDSLNHPSDFAMETGIITENCLYLLASNFVHHLVKGISLHLKGHLGELKAKDCGVSTFACDVRMKLAAIHHVEPDEIVIMSLSEGCIVVNYLIPRGANISNISNLNTQFQECFRDSFRFCVLYQPFHQMNIDSNVFDPRWNRDFRVAANCPVNEQRGRMDYTPPARSVRFGMNVLGKFSDGNTWIGMQNTEAEWPVAYHGTHCYAVKQIAETYLVAGHINALGVGIYCSPNPTVAAGFARTPLRVNTSNGVKSYKCIFMCRVNAQNVHSCPEGICLAFGNPEEYTLHITHTRDYWFANQNNQGSRCIRTYGILLLEVS
jgi:hypothetical protein